MYKSARRSHTSEPQRVDPCDCCGKGGVCDSGNTVGHLTSEEGAPVLPFGAPAAGLLCGRIKMVAPAQHALVVSSTQILQLAEVEAAGLSLGQYNVQVATNVALSSLKSTAGASFDAVMLSLTGAAAATVEGFVAEVCLLDHGVGLLSTQTVGFSCNTRARRQYNSTFGFWVGRVLAYCGRVGDWCYAQQVQK